MTENEVLFAKITSTSTGTAAYDQAHGRHNDAPAPQSVTPTGVKDALPAPSPFASVKRR